MASGFQSPINKPMKQQLISGGKSVATGGASTVDRLTGNNVAKGIDKAGELAGKYNPFSVGHLEKAQGPDESALRMVQEGGKFEDAGFNTTAVDTGWADDARRHQAMVASQLRDQALGQGPSIAGQQMRAGQEAAMAQSRAALASSRGGANPLAARAAIQANQAGQLDIAQKAGIARLQEQQMAAQNFGSLANQMRSTDLQTAELKAQQQNQFNQLRQGYINSGMDAQKANQLAALEFERMKVNTNQANTDMMNQARTQQKGMVGQAFGGGMRAIAAAKTGGASEASGAGSAIQNSAPGANPPGSR